MTTDAQFSTENLNLWDDSEAVKFELSGSHILLDMGFKEALDLEFAALGADFNLSAEAEASAFLEVYYALDVNAGSYDIVYDAVIDDGVFLRRGDTLYLSTAALDLTGITSTIDAPRLEFDVGFNANVFANLDTDFSADIPLYGSFFDELAALDFTFGERGAVSNFSLLNGSFDSADPTAGHLGSDIENWGIEIPDNPLFEFESALGSIVFTLPSMPDGTMSDYGSDFWYQDLAQRHDAAAFIESTLDMDSVVQTLYASGKITDVLEGDFQFSALEGDDIWGADVIQLDVTGAYNAFDLELNVDTSVYQTINFEALGVEFSSGSVVAEKTPIGGLASFDMSTLGPDVTLGIYGNTWVETGLHFDVTLDVVIGQLNVDFELSTALGDTTLTVDETLFQDTLLDLDFSLPIWTSDAHEVTLLSDSIFDLSAIPDAGPPEIVPPRDGVDDPAPNPGPDIDPSPPPDEAPENAADLNLYGRIILPDVLVLGETATFEFEVHSTGTYEASQAPKHKITIGDQVHLVDGYRNYVDSGDGDFKRYSFSKVVTADWLERTDVSIELDIDNVLGERDEGDNVQTTTFRALAEQPAKMPGNIMAFDIFFGLNENRRSEKHYLGNTEYVHQFTAYNNTQEDIRQEGIYRIWLSENGVVDSASTLLFEGILHQLSDKDKDPYKDKFRLPADLKNQDQFLILELDADHEIAERDENDNVYVRPIRTIEQVKDGLFLIVENGVSLTFDLHNEYKILDGDAVISVTNHKGEAVNGTGNWKPTDVARFKDGYAIKFEHGSRVEIWAFEGDGALATKIQDEQGLADHQWVFEQPASVIPPEDEVGLFPIAPPETTPDASLSSQLSATGRLQVVDGDAVIDVSKSNGVASYPKSHWLIDVARYEAGYAIRFENADDGRIVFWTLDATGRQTANFDQPGDVAEFERLFEMPEEPGLLPIAPPDAFFFRADEGYNIIKEPDSGGNLDMIIIDDGLAVSGHEDGGNSILQLHGTTIVVENTGLDELAGRIEYLSGGDFEFI